MLRAVVVGNVWASRKLAELPNGAFLEVEVEDSGARLVAFDVLGSGLGERVLVATGSVAAAWFPGQPPPLDALIIGSIDADTATAVPVAAGFTAPEAPTVSSTEPAPQPPPPPPPTTPPPPEAPAAAPDAAVDQPWIDDAPEPLPPVQAAPEPTPAPPPPPDPAPEPTPDPKPDQT